MKRVRKVTDAEAEAMLVAYAETESFAKAGEICGCSQGTVHRALRKRGWITVTPRGPRGGDNGNDRRRLPKKIVDAIAEDYARLKSVARVADRCGRTRQSVWDILHRRGLTLPPKPCGPAVMHKGEKFTVGKNGYLRSTTFASRKKGCSRLLHRVIWEETHGPVPAGKVLWFTDENRENCALGNLECITRTEVRRRMAVNGRNKNAWTCFYEVHDHLLGEWERAVAEGRPAAEIGEAQRVYESLERPNLWTPKRARTHRAQMKKYWAQFTPAERRARALKMHAERRRRRDAQFGTVVEAMLAAA